MLRSADRGDSVRLLPYAIAACWLASAAAAFGADLAGPTAPAPVPAPVVAAPPPPPPPPLSPAAQSELFLTKAPVALDPKWGVHVFAGASAGHDSLIGLMENPWDGHYGDNYLVAGDVSYRLVRFWNYFVIDTEAGVGYRFKQVNAPEAWVAAYLRFDGFPWNHWLYTTAAASTGLSYVEKLSDVEHDSGGRGNPAGSKLLHYFSPEFTFALPDHRNSEVVLRWHHRSGVFGLFWGVWGASNVVTLGFRQRF
jgi:hypothetical protein